MRERHYTLEAAARIPSIKQVAAVACYPAAPAAAAVAATWKMQRCVALRVVTHRCRRRLRTLLFSALQGESVLLQGAAAVKYPRRALLTDSGGLLVEAGANLVFACPYISYLSLQRLCRRGVGVFQTTNRAPSGTPAAGALAASSVGALLDYCGLCI